MMRPDANVEKVYLYLKPVDFRKYINGLAALVELDVKVAVFDPVLFVFLNRPRNRLPRIEVIHELSEYELTCACGCRKHVIGEETSEQREIVPMQIHVLKHIRNVYGCRGFETAPVTADKPLRRSKRAWPAPMCWRCC